MRSTRSPGGAWPPCSRPTRRSKSASGACARSTTAETTTVPSPLPRSGAQMEEPAAGGRRPRDTLSVTASDQGPSPAPDKTLSDELEEWLTGEGDRTLG